MNNAILIQHAYKGEFEPMLELTRARNEAYCQAHNFDYWCECYDDPRWPVEHGGWVKIDLIQKAMKAGYEYIVWLDADAMIADMETDLRDAIQPNRIGACWHRIPQLNHWNVGVLYLDNSPETRGFISDWLASYSEPKDGWKEQGVFNRMAMKSKTVVTLSDKWNATINVSMVPDAVVLGFHGAGNAQQRYGLMKQALAELEKHGSKETA
jgi:hypothetical protein